jgi:hypothetical protein
MQLRSIGLKRGVIFFRDQVRHWVRRCRPATLTRRSHVSPAMRQATRSLACNLGFVFCSKSTSPAWLHWRLYIRKAYAIHLTTSHSAPSFSSPVMILQGSHTLGLVRLAHSRPGMWPKPRGYPGLGSNTGPRKNQRSVNPSWDRFPARNPLVHPTQPGNRPSSPLGRKIPSRHDATRGLSRHSAPR